jgi:hypothetical protein
MVTRVVISTALVSIKLDSLVSKLSHYFVLERLFCSHVWISCMLKIFTMDLGLRGEPPQGSINSVRGVWSPPTDNFPDRLSQATGSDVNRDLQSLVAHPHSAIPQSVVLRAAGEQRRKLPSGRCLVSNFPAEYQTPTEKRLNATSENSSFKACSGYNLLRGRKDCSPIRTTIFP